MPQISTVNQTWNLEAIFPTRVAWEAEHQSLGRDLQQISLFQGKLGDSPQSLFHALELANSHLARSHRIRVYAHLQHAGDTRDSDAQLLTNRAQQLGASVGQAQAFIDPEILALGQEQIHRFLEQEPALEKYRFYLQELERSRKHTRSPEVEEVLAILAPTLDAPEVLHTALNSGDLRFQPITVNGSQKETSHGSIDELLGSPDREVRAAAYTNYHLPYQQFARTFAATLIEQAQTSARFAKLKGYESTLARDLAAENLPESVFDTVLNVCAEHLPLMQRYFRARAAVLGIPTIAEYDIPAPLGKTPPVIPYPRAVESVIASLAPLGETYQEIARTGLTELRWADVPPRPGKYNNPFSSGTWGTQPYMLLNYTEDMQNVGTLAHELGHSMHSWFSNQAQPRHYSRYSMMVAETASNLNQVLLRAHLFPTADRETKLALLDEAFANIHRYLFLFPTLSKVEHHLHSAFTTDTGISARELQNVTIDAFSKAYGSSVSFDPEQVGVKWAQFGHFFAPYYLFKYAVGISSAMAIGQRILEGDTDIRDRYLNLLTCGGSKPTLELFAQVDIDITSPEPYRQAFELVESYVQELEGLAMPAATVSSAPAS